MCVRASDVCVYVCARASDVCLCVSDTCVSDVFVCE